MEKLKITQKEYLTLSLFFYQYNWKEIEFSSHRKDWKKFKQNNNTIDINILYVPYNTKQIRPAYISKSNHERDNQVILLIITDDGKKWHYLAVKKLSALFRGITSTYKGDFDCLNCLHSLQNKRNT